MKLWDISGGAPRTMNRTKLDTEARLEDWLEQDIGMLDPALLVIGRQVQPPHGGRVDLLAINVDGALFVIELKRDMTPREVVAQVLDYASWAASLDTPAIHEIAERYWQAKGLRFAQAFADRFDAAVPEPLNTTHNLVIVAGALDPASRRIVQYLSTVHGVGINTAFFTVFDDAGRRLLVADWLMDQAVVEERTERRVRAPWSGKWYVNTGESEHRAWEDMRRHGFVAAGHGRVYADALKRLSVDDEIYAYQKGQGYVGHGVIVAPAAMARDVEIHGTRLLSLPLVQPGLALDCDDPELSEYVVLVDWKQAVPLKEGKTFSGAFANPNVVCRLRDQRTLEFLSSAFA